MFEVIVTNVLTNKTWNKVFDSRDDAFRYYCSMNQESHLVCEFYRKNR